ncbi:hypothetical protein BCR42DRAFT_393909 [Absidia repens]|uniref:Uncharacterized protein n=1 Tax=Absidia repens TaxID=90262 RepID=A0A1X2IBP3_9FUNG|nr:hypothetical protein BCR42DRAFT_393909 [Absidia repens]
MPSIKFDRPDRYAEYVCSKNWGSVFFMLTQRTISVVILLLLHPWTIFAKKGKPPVEEYGNDARASVILMNRSLMPLCKILIGNLPLPGIPTFSMKQILHLKSVDGQTGDEIQDHSLFGIKIMWKDYLDYPRLPWAIIIIKIATPSKSKLFISLYFYNAHSSSYGYFLYTPSCTTPLYVIQQSFQHILTLYS